jgi:tRNA threonylcarbamoyladenosine biosynthesis protein TsaB
MSQAFTLILETSTPEASIGLAGPDGFLKERVFRSDRNHNATLFAPLQELLADAGEIARVLVGSGPGSYSGTRVGIAAAQGVAIALDCPVIAVPSVLGVEPVAAGHSSLAVGDARRGTYWSARLDGARMAEPLLEEADDWQGTLSRARAEGRRLFSFEDPRRWSLPSDIHVEEILPRARWLWEAWHAADAPTRTMWQAELPQPLYLKPPHITQARSTLVRGERPAGR